MALTVAAITVGSGGSDPPPGDAKVEPAPSLEDPAEQGRALADWLRERSAGGSQ